ncbi:collagen alpha-1(I) chain-like [Penaeus chinensis]|uniref:collagen alpha-1(I) chain-like n=1 Tax=Penaeus chinensis TaxID=139456 RepID=UPI001FB57467|nr:collagen alpha-1(I) chain-like [Penaeus chinensis]
MSRSSGPPVSLSRSFLPAPGILTPGEKGRGVGRPRRRRASSARGRKAGVLGDLGGAGHPQPGGERQGCWATSEAPGILSPGEKGRGVGRPRRRRASSARGRKAGVLGDLGGAGHPQPGGERQGCWATSEAPGILSPGEKGRGVGRPRRRRASSARGRKAGVLGDLGGAGHPQPGGERQGCWATSEAPGILSPGEKGRGVGRPRRRRASSARGRKAGVLGDLGGAGHPQPGGERQGCWATSEAPGILSPGEKGRGVGRPRRRRASSARGRKAGVLGDLGGAGHPQPGGERQGCWATSEAPGILSPGEKGRGVGRPRRRRASSARGRKAGVLGDLGGAGHPQPGGERQGCWATSEAPGILSPGEKGRGVGRPRRRRASSARGRKAGVLGDLGGAGHPQPGGERQGCWATSEAPGILSPGEKGRGVGRPRRRRASSARGRKAGVLGDLGGAGHPQPGGERQGCWATSEAPGILSPGEKGRGVGRPRRRRASSARGRKAGVLGDLGGARG